MTRVRPINSPTEGQHISWETRVSRNTFNLNTFPLGMLKLAGKYDFPVLGRVGPEDAPDALFPFDERNKFKDDGTKQAIHFYCEDAEFESVWLRLARSPHFPAVVGKAGMAITPDWSLFTDYPLATQIWNVYRSRLAGAVWALQGITVIPSVVWGDRSSYEWCFDGLPKHSVLAISTCHVNPKKGENIGFFEGFRVMADRLEPSHVLVYGMGLKGELESVASQSFKITRFNSRLTQIRRRKPGQLELLERL